ncbi:hypothetical protein [Aeromonas veronii]|uniref:hypothetical protein n=1 Tax=Aeromonas veronii TaxID=654 RepID=UPI002246636D|nr:hypothetical protein [Aeromonas veronii]MCX0435266.1 hypothetical protein [Aeromonas veronii]
MTININGRNAQGEALPKFGLQLSNDILTVVCGNVSSLLDKVQQGRILPAGGLDTHQHGLRIRHPQAESLDENMPHIPKLRPLRRRFIQFRGMGREPKKTPRLRLSIEGRCLAATRSAIVSNSMEITLMIYTFLILHSRTCRLADLHRIRTISAFAKDEHQARAALAGLPLVFLSRTPRIGSQA